MSATTSLAEQPLSGVTVVELGTSLAAPYAAMVLGQLGARVIKVESPRGGDPARFWGPPVSQGSSIAFQAVNRNKKSVTVDLADVTQRDALADFIANEADVCLQNMRPKAVEDIGLDAKTLRARSPRLVYCNMGAFGAKGPLAHLPGYDPLMQAFTGICHVTGPEDGEPCRVGVPVVDFGTGMWAVIGIQAALMRRHQSGEGGLVDVSLFETAMGWMSLAMSTVMTTGKTPGRYGTRGPGAIAPNQGFHAADGMLLITAGTSAQFFRLAEVLGKPEWTDDERFNSPLGRRDNAATLCGEIAAIIATKPRQVWLAALEDANVPSAPIQSPDEALAHPQTQQSGILERSDDGTPVQVNVPLSLDGQRLVQGRPAPGLGDDNDVLR